MPRIPMYQGSVELTKKAPNRLVDAESFKVNDSRGDILSEQGKAIQAAAAQMEKVRDLSETTFAQTEAAKRLNDIHLRAIESPDIWGAGKIAQDEISKLKSELSPKITSDIARMRFEAAFDTDAMQYMNRINSALREKQLSETSAGALAYIDEKKQEYFNSPPTEQQIIKTQIKEKIGEMVKIGAWKADVAYKEYRDIESKLRIGQVDSDANVDPETTLSELEKGKQGFYYDLTQDERNEAIKDTKAKLEKAKKSFERNLLYTQKKNESQMIVDWANESLTKEQIKDSLASGNIRRPFAEKMFNKLYESENPNTDTSEYIKIRAMIYDNAPIENINQEIIDNSQKISNSDKRRLIDTAYSETDKKQKDTIKYNASALRIWANRTLGDFYDGNDLSADVVYEFHKRVDAEKAQGSRIDDIAQELIREKIKVYFPTTALQKDVPNFIADRNSIKKLYERESKLKGKATPARPAQSSGTGVSFDDL